MNSVIKIFLILLKVLNYWFFVIPSKFSILVLFGYNFAIYLYFGKWSVEAVQQYYGYDSVAYLLFNLFIVFPMFWSFLNCWTAAKMTSSGFSGQVNTALNNAIAYRNGQMSNKTAQEAFGIYKDTVHLDLIKANQSIPQFDKALQGFNAQFGNKTPQEAFNAFTKK